MTAFIDTVLQYFDQLAARHGLRCVSSTPAGVRFENEKVFLQVMFAAGGSFEVGVEIGEIQVSAEQPERPFNLSEVLRLHAAPDTTYVERLQATKPDVLINAIERLAVLTEKYAADLLDGNPSEFLLLGEFRDKDCAEYALSRDLRYAREDAEKAWVAKNHFAVVKAYKPLESELTAVERKRLEFSEKQLQVSGCGWGDTVV